MSRVVDFVRNRAVYLWILAVLPIVQVFAYSFNPGVPVFKGHSIGVVVFYLGLGVAVLAWLPFRRQGKLNGLAAAFFFVAIAAWMYQVTRTQLDQSTFEIFAFGTPVALVMILLKPPSQRDVSDAFLSLAYALIGVSLASLVLGRLDLVPHEFFGNNPSFPSTRLPILADLFGIQDRWSGPFGNPNFAGPVGAYLVVYGACLRGWQRGLFAGAGIVVLVLSQGRTALLATLAGLLVVLLWSAPVARWRYRAAVRWAALVAVVFGSVTYIVMLDPTINGRTPLWSDFLNLWSESPVLGVGTRRIIEFQDSKVAEGFVGFSDAHNVLLDGLVRHGVIMLALGVTLYAIAAIVGVRRLRTNDVMPLALVAFVVVAGMSETVHSWSYWSFYLVVLSLAVLSDVPTPSLSGLRSRRFAGEAGH